MKDVNILTRSGIDVESSLTFLGDMEIYDATVEEFLETIDPKLEDIKNIRKYMIYQAMPFWYIL